MAAWFAIICHLTFVIACGGVVLSVATGQAGKVGNKIEFYLNEDTAQMITVNGFK